MQENKRDKLIEKLISFLLKIDKNMLLHEINEKNKDEIFQYLENELFSLDEIKELVSSFNYNKPEILNIFYDLIKLYFDEENKVYRKTEDLYNLASKNSFNWPDKKACLDKIEEELSELKLALLKNDKKNIKEEIGDILFTLNNFANLNKLDITECLDIANKKFEERFHKLRKHAKHENINLRLASPEIKEKLWEKAKKELQSS